MEPYLRLGILLIDFQDSLNHALQCLIKCSQYNVINNCVSVEQKREKEDWRNCGGKTEDICCLDNAFNCYMGILYSSRNYPSSALQPKSISIKDVSSERSKVSTEPNATHALQPKRPAMIKLIID